MEREKEKKKAKPFRDARYLLGSGLARRAAELLSGRQRDLDKRVEKAVNGE